jgi:hypothetical protein
MSEPWWVQQDRQVTGAGPKVAGTALFLREKGSKPDLG